MLKAYLTNADSLTIVFSAWKSQTVTSSHSNMLLNCLAHLSLHLVSGLYMWLTSYRLCRRLWSITGRSRSPGCCSADLPWFLGALHGKPPYPFLSSERLHDCCYSLTESLRAIDSAVLQSANTVTESKIRDGAAGAWERMILLLLMARASRKCYLALLIFFTESTSSWKMQQGKQCLSTLQSRLYTYFDSFEL